MGSHEDISTKSHLHHLRLESLFCVPCYPMLSHCYLLLWSRTREEKRRKKCFLYFYSSIFHKASSSSSSPIAAGPPRAGMTKDIRIIQKWNHPHLMILISFVLLVRLGFFFSFRFTDTLRVWALHFSYSFWSHWQLIWLVCAKACFLFVGTSADEC